MKTRGRGGGLGCGSGWGEGRPRGGGQYYSHKYCKALTLVQDNTIFATFMKSIHRNIIIVSTLSTYLEKGK